MHIVVGRLSARYSGRGNSYLPPHDRIVLLKQDSSVSIHNEKGFKPLNYMMAPTVRTQEEDTEGNLLWRFQGKGEMLEIIFYKIYDEINLDLLGEDPGIQRESTETHLQKWLTEHIHLLDPHLKDVWREAQTGDGPVDLLAAYDQHNYLAIEVKRVAPMNAVGQLLRYLDALGEHNPGNHYEGVLAAVEFKEKTLELAAKKGIRCFHIPPEWKEEGTPEVSLAQPLTEGLLEGLFSSWDE